MAWAASAVDTPVQVNHAARSARTQHQPFAVDINLVAADTADATLVTAKTNHSIFVTKIMFSVTTDAAQTVLFKDSAGTPIPIAMSKSSPGLGPIVWEFGEDGTKLTEEKNLVATLSGAGLAGRIHVEGYQKRTKVAAA